MRHPMATMSVLCVDPSSLRCSCRVSEELGNHHVFVWLPWRCHGGCQSKRLPPLHKSECVPTRTTAVFLHLPLGCALQEHPCDTALASAQVYSSRPVCVTLAPGQCEAANETVTTEICRPPAAAQSAHSLEVGERQHGHHSGPGNTIVHRRSREVNPSAERQCLRAARTTW